jgi:transposase
VLCFHQSRPSNFPCHSSQIRVTFSMYVCTLRRSMEQRAVVRVLTLKRLKSGQIDAELKTMSGPDALALATVKKWSKCFREVRTDLSDNPTSGPPLTHDLAEAIRSVLRERPFTSCKVLCEHFRIAKATCLHILHNDLGLKEFHLCWVPYTLDSNAKNERVCYSRLLLEALEQAKQNGFRGVITGDESRFFLFYSRDSALAESRFGLPARAKQNLTRKSA